MALDLTKMTGYQKRGQSVKKSTGGGEDNKPYLANGVIIYRRGFGIGGDLPPNPLTGKN